jgi:hypothetical protein
VATCFGLIQAIVRRISTCPQCMLLCYLHTYLQCILYYIHIILSSYLCCMYNSFTRVLSVYYLHTCSQCILSSHFSTVYIIFTLVLTVWCIYFTVVTNALHCYTKCLCFVVNISDDLCRLLFRPFHSHVECSHAADTLTSSSSFRVSFLPPEGGFIS